MRERAGLVVVLAFVGVVLGFGQLRADDEAPAEADHHEAQPEAEHHETQPAEAEHHEQAGEHHEEAGGAAEADRDDADDEHDARPYNKFDLDGDGKADPELEKEYEADFAGIPATIDTDAVDKELESRPEDQEMKPSMTVEQFQKIVRIVKKVVLDRMEKKMAKSSAKKMRRFSIGISVFSLLGLLLLGMPLVLRKKYPGQDKTLFKYSALAAVTFLVTVNLFGGVLYGMKSVQGEFGSLTNPSLAIAGGTFDTLDRRADEYITMGRELVAPTLEQLQGNSEEQPSVTLLENGQKIVKDAKVFVSVAKMFKKLDFVFKVLPIILFGVTMILFGLAIRPTLTEIIKLPILAASGKAGVGRDTTKKAMSRVSGELLATLCTLGVLAVLTFLSAAVLGRIVSPALHELLWYFALSVDYLQFVEGASSGLVFLALFGVILFLVLNLAVLILSMSFFLGKCQRIFQQKFNEKVPLDTHKRFFSWGIPAVIFVQLLPWLYSLIADTALLKINDSLLDVGLDADKISWTKLMLAGPAFLVVGFLVVFWAARGIKAIGFLASYKVKPQSRKPSVPGHTPGEPV